MHLYKHKTHALSAACRMLNSLLVVLPLLSYSALSQTIDNVTQSSPGAHINGPIDPEMGRLSTIEYLGGYVITIP